jgi:dipeptidyl aminopeptidase/acylaminoacyl peptidase
MRVRAFQIEGSRENLLNGDVYLPEKGDGFPLLIYCHGFKGFKDWGCNPLIAKHLANDGIASVFFNFSYNGVVPDIPDDITDGESFGNNNLSTELDDLGKVLDAIENDVIDDFKNINKSSIHLLGHSRGGGIVLLKTQEDSRVKTCTSLAGVSDFEPYTHWIPREQWKEEGVSWWSIPELRAVIQCITNLWKTI